MSALAHGGLRLISALDKMGGCCTRICPNSRSQRGCILFLCFLHGTRLYSHAQGAVIYTFTHIYAPSGTPHQNHQVTLPTPGVEGVARLAEDSGTQYSAIESSGHPTHPGVEGAARLLAEDPCTIYFLFFFGVLSPLVLFWIFSF